MIGQAPDTIPIGADPDLLTLSNHPGTYNIFVRKEDRSIRDRHPGSFDVLVKYLDNARVPVSIVLRSNTRLSESRYSPL